MRYLLTFLILAMAPACFAGDAEGNGGGDLAYDFYQAAKQAVFYTKNNREKFPEVDIAALTNALNTAEIVIVPKALTVECVINGVPSTPIACNSKVVVKNEKGEPVKNENGEVVTKYVIRVAELGFAQSPNKVVIGGHEYLSIINAEKNNNHISDRYAGIQFRGMKLSEAIEMVVAGNLETNSSTPGPRDWTHVQGRTEKFYMALTGLWFVHSRFYKLSKYSYSQKHFERYPMAKMAEASFNSYFRDLMRADGVDLFARTEGQSSLAELGGNNTMMTLTRYLAAAFLIMPKGGNILPDRKIQKVADYAMYLAETRSFDGTYCLWCERGEMKGLITELLRINPPYYSQLLGID
jgi:hypothetical protein